MTGLNPYQGMKFLDETGLLAQILPELKKLKGVPQPEQFHPEGDVFTHTLLMLKELKNASLLLAFSCLLHDVGKPDTYRVAERIRFDRHDKVGSEIAQVILKRLRFSNHDINKITACIENHMHIMNAPKMRLYKLKTLLLRPTFLEELELHRIDCVASHRDLKIYRFLKKSYDRLKSQLVMPRPLLNGYELMQLNIPEGPQIGKLQKKLLPLQLEGKIKSKAEAKRWVKRNS